MRIWLKTPNPLKLEAPPLWWQQLVFDYDKMLRIMPSQIENMYRLCRLVRREARLGLQAMVIHEHPDTVQMIKHGTVPVAAVFPWAIRSNKIIRDLQARDTWLQGGAEKVVEKIEKQEREAEAQQQHLADAEQDALLTNAFRAVKFGRPGHVHLEGGPKGERRRRLARQPLRPVPAPSRGRIELAGKYTKIDTRLQNRVPSRAVK
jgi:hypothetical protein